MKKKSSSRRYHNNYSDMDNLNPSENENLNNIISPIKRNSKDIYIKPEDLNSIGLSVQGSVDSHTKYDQAYISETIQLNVSKENIINSRKDSNSSLRLIWAGLPSTAIPSSIMAFINNDSNHRANTDIKIRSIEYIKHHDPDNSILFDNNFTEAYLIGRSVSLVYKETQASSSDRISGTILGQDSKNLSLLQESSDSDSSQTIVIPLKDIIQLSVDNNSNIESNYYFGPLAMIHADIIFNEEEENEEIENDHNENILSNLSFDITLLYQIEGIEINPYYQAIIQTRDNTPAKIQFIGKYLIVNSSEKHFHNVDIHLSQKSIKKQSTSVSKFSIGSGSSNSSQTKEFTSDAHIINDVSLNPMSRNNVVMFDTGMLSINNSEESAPKNVCIIGDYNSDFLFSDIDFIDMQRSHNIDQVLPCVQGINMPNLIQNGLGMEYLPHGGVEVLFTPESGFFPIRKNLGELGGTNVLGIKHFFIPINVLSEHKIRAEFKNSGLEVRKQEQQMTEKFSYKIENHWKNDIHLYIVNHFHRWQRWDIIQSNSEWFAFSSFSAVFPVSVNFDETQQFQHTVMYTWDIYESSSSRSIDHNHENSNEEITTDLSDSSDRENSSRRRRNRNGSIMKRRTGNDNSDCLLM